MPDFGYQDFYDAFEDYLSSTASASQNFLSQNPFQSVNFWANAPGTDTEWDYNFYQYGGMSDDIMGALAGAFQFQPNTEYAPWSTQDYAFNIGSEGYWDESDAMWNEASLNLGTALPFVDIFDPQSIASNLSDIYDIEGEPIRTAEIQALTPDMLAKTTSQYYNPYESAKREELIESRAMDIGKISPEGFAGSGIYSGELGEIKQQYSSGYGKILEDIMNLRGQATDDVMGVIGSWQELINNQLGE